jgi:hypothetical protein
VADHLELEEAMILGLRNQYKSDKADAFKARYFAAKGKLFKEILPWIQANEPNLSDHGEKHIENVLNNAYKLISSDIASTKPMFSGLDLYFLCQVCLFHDVGNFYGRKQHNLKITEIINKSFSDLFDGDNKRERRLIAEAGRAHTGKHGSDTLFHLFNKSEHIQGDHINYCALAAIVRFADELAEGPQRTSAFMLSENKFSSDSQIYHKYASCTHIKIDSPNQRISISYEFNINTDNSNDVEITREQLQELINFTHARIAKLDQERKYYNYYNGISKPIKETQVNFSFQKDDYDLDYKIEPLILNDLIVPGNSEPLFLASRADLAADNIWNSISKELFAEEQS